MPLDRPLTRIAPQGPAHIYKTFEIQAPEPTHHRDATCAEVDCGNRREGWVTYIDESAELGQRQAHYIRKLSGRRFAEEGSPDGRRKFIFPPGQTCFGHHRTRLDREEFYVVRGGDWRGNPRRELMIHDTPENWADDFATHQDKLKRAHDG